ncbi:MAG: hypothetical protein K0S65_2005 [Labilithrix sp.]|nr:hypothetical protein [Labilithrix sp.]
MNFRTAILPCIALALAFPLGCDGSDSSDSEAEDALDVKDASYSVPVASDLGASATYPVTTSILWTVEGETARLRYRLPADLVGGERQGVSMTGSWNAEAGAYELSGAVGTAKCRVDATLLHCEEQLPGIHVDLAAVQKRLAGTPDEAARLEVSRRFSVDPIGILAVHANDVDDKAR